MCMYNMWRRTMCGVGSEAPTCGMEALCIGQGQRWEIDGSFFLGPSP
uniref:Alternative protein C6orf132 n=1 Tax=Homo sapiens TaxID=9606 RepID=L8E8A3_HUMAN|nr:alternative protein C6orf132 [Homo sapiens]